MQARVCIQNFDNGDIQGFLYIDAGSGEMLVTTSPRYTAGGKGSSGFPISGIVGSVEVDASVDVVGRTVDFTVSTNGGATTSLFTRSLATNGSNCTV